MRPRKHPSDDLLTAFAMGRLSPAPALVVGAHVGQCERCRLHIATLEEVEGASLASLAPAPMASDALDRALARIDAASDRPRAVPPASWVGDVALPDAVVAVGVGSRRWLAPGLWAAPVGERSADNWRVFLLRIPPRTAIPAHGHHGSELIAVLSGAFDSGERFEAGDFSESDQGADHSLRATAEGPCACLVGVEGGFQWRGWSRLLTPLLGV